MLSIFPTETKMPACSAYGCTNRSTQFKMYRFPADPERTKLWLVKTKRDQWEPNQNSRLCETHFEDKCFFTKATPAGIKKFLTKDTVPTIFSFKEPARKRKSPKKRGPLQDITNKPATPSKVIHDHGYAYTYRSKVQHQTSHPYR